MKNPTKAAAAAIALGVAIGTAPFAAADPSGDEVAHPRSTCNPADEGVWCSDLDRRPGDFAIGDGGELIPLSNRIPVPLNPCSNSASPYCANSGLPVEMAPLSPEADVCEELYSYTKADHRPGEIVSVPQRLIAPAKAAGCDIPAGIAQ